MRYKRLLLVCGAVIWLTAGCAPETQEAKEEIRQEEATVEAGDTGSIDAEKEEDRSEEAVEEESDRKTVKIYLHGQNPLCSWYILLSDIHTGEKTGQWRLP